MNKTCFKCGELKHLDEYYTHNAMMDGHLNKCKDCTKKDVKAREVALLKTPGYREKERKRGRDKYHRLGYKGKHKPAKESEKIRNRSRRIMFPEKYKATNASQRIPIEKDHRHHWSYNKEHWTDIIDLTMEEHSTIHRYMVYDQERMMYRECVSGILLDTKESHLKLLKDVSP